MPHQGTTTTTADQTTTKDGKTARDLTRSFIASVKSKESQRMVKKRPHPAISP